MGKLQFFKYSTIGLLLLNLGMVAFFFITKPPGPANSKDGFNNGIIKILELDGRQNDMFLDLSGQHKKDMIALDNQQRELLSPYFQTVIDSTKNVDTEAILLQVQNLERQKIESTYHHFQDVKSILKTEQQPYFEKFMNVVLKRILWGDKK